jgi:hypothetical protein
MRPGSLWMVGSSAGEPTGVGCATVAGCGVSAGALPPRPGGVTIGPGWEPPAR